MSDTKTGGWRMFWAPFATGWALFIFMAATNSRLATTASPTGILDHQSAGTAARVDEIQSAWTQAGTLGFAKTSMHLDLLFIGLVTMGALIGCAMAAGRATSPAMRAVALLTAAAWIVFGVSDYTETIAQVVQVHSAGSDQLAGLAKAVGLPKAIGFVLGNLLLIAVLLWFRAARAKAA